MDLIDYLRANKDPRPNKEKIHTDLILDFLDRIDELNIKKPYEIFREVRIITPKGEYKTQSDIIILNSKLYIVEAKVLRPSKWEKKDKPLETRINFTRNSIIRQLKPANDFFKEYFNRNSVCSGIYRLEGEKDFSHYFFKFQEKKDL